MGRSASAGNLGDDYHWAERSEYWRNYREPKKGPQRKFNYREPLILSGHGAGIKIHRNTLLVRNGFTHYPQQVDENRFFPGAPNLPDRIIILDGSGAISFDALRWMAEQNIEFVQLDWRGQIANVGGNSGYSGNSKLISAQKAIKGTKKEIEIARQLIAKKILNSIGTLHDAFPNSARREIALHRLARNLEIIEEPRNCLTISKILGIEGSTASAYFSIWQGLPIKWSGFKRRPIPGDWQTTVPRTMGWRRRARQARHPVNAMLNYGYGILANQLRGQISAAGLNPIIGLIHGTRENRIPLVYDLMEPIRPKIDRKVLDFALSNTFTPGDFTITKWGGCRLNPQLAKAVVQKLSKVDVRPTVNGFLELLL